MDTEASQSKIWSVILFFGVMVVLLLTSLYITGGLEGFIGKKQTVYVAFHESVTGLRKGSPVTLSGVNVGRVESIDPMTSPDARELVRGAQVVVPDSSESSRRASAEIMSGKKFMSRRPPLVLATLKTRKASIPLNKQTHVSLITTDFTASQAVRFSAGSEEESAQLTGKTVVFSAEPSPLSRLKARFLDRETGVLREENVENIHGLIQNLKKVSNQLARITDQETEQKIDRLLSSHTDLADRLNEWLRVKPECPNSQQLVSVKKVQTEQGTKYRYDCPGSERGWTEDHPPKQGRITLVFDRMNTLLTRLNKLTEQGKRNGSIPKMVEDVSELSRNLNRTSQSMTAVVQENRARIRSLLKSVNQLANKLDAVATELEQDPSSAVFGRRGPELTSPYED